MSRKKMKPVKMWAQVYVDDGELRGTRQRYSAPILHRNRAFAREAAAKVNADFGNIVRIAKVEIREV